MDRKLFLSTFKNLGKKLTNMQNYRFIHRGFDISSRTNLSKIEQLKILTTLKKALNVSDGEDDTYSLLTFLDLFFDNDNDMFDNLENLKNFFVSNTIRRKLDKLISEIKKYKSAISLPESSYQSEKQRRIEQSLEFPLVHGEQNPVLYKIYDRRRFAFKKLVVKKLPTVYPKYDTSAFDSLNRNQLINLYDSSNFYKLTKKEKLALLQASINDYCKSLGVPSCAIIPQKLGKDGEVVKFGEYDPSTGFIAINSELLDNINYWSKDKNQFLPYKLLAVSIHEARHRYQHFILDKENLSLKESIIKDAFMQSPSLLYSDYLSSADELDARDASLNYFKEAAFATNDLNKKLKLASFHNLTKGQEIKNNKTAISDDISKYFPNIYDGNYLLYDQQIVDVPIGCQNFYHKFKQIETQPNN